MVTTGKRTLGKSGIEVSPMGLGCWAIGGPFRLFGIPDGWGEVDDGESIKAIHKAIELGVTFFDTADAYGTGHSEEVLGKAIKGIRGDVVIATKGGYVADIASKNLIGEDTSPQYIRKAVEASLKRLGTDYVDLYQIHNGEMPEDHIEPLFFELSRLVAEGKIRTYGWSTYVAKNVRTFAEKTNGTVIQCKGNLFSYDAEISDLCKTHQLASINNGPLAMGVLSGKFNETTRFSADDVRGANHSWTEYFENGRLKTEYLLKLNHIKEILKSGGRTVAQGALAWLWARSDSNIPIPGFKSVKQAEENAKAMEFGPLTEDQMRQIEALIG